MYIIIYLKQDDSMYELPNLLLRNELLLICFDIPSTTIVSCRIEFNCEEGEGEAWKMMDEHKKT